MRRALLAFTVFGLSFVSGLASCGGDGAAEPSATPDAAPDSAVPAETGSPPLVEAGVREAGPTCIDRLVDPVVVDGSKASEVTVLNDPGAPQGIFDPSLVYPTGAPGGVMAYSAVRAKDDIVTRLAVSADEGASWTYLSSPNAAVPTPGGNLIHEVSSLVVDSADPDPNKRWKLFSHRYLAKGNELFYVIGNIALQTAPAPEGPWSTPTANVGWRGENAFSSEGAVLVAQDVPALADCVAFTEPSAIALPGGLLGMSLGCVSVAPKLSIRVVLLLSSDHAASWSYRGVLFPAQDAPCLGRTPGLERVNAAELFGAGGKAWAFVTPELGAVGYRGCAAVEVTDFATATASRDSETGAPLVTKLFTTPSDDQFSGACAYAEGAKKATALMSVIVPNQARPFRIFRTGASIP